MKSVSQTIIVLNRVKWDTLNGAKILLGLIIHVIPATWPLIILVDETIERRKGNKIKVKGCYRDAVKSSHNKVVHCFGIKWISMMAVVPLPWSRRPWALPFFTVLAQSKSYNKAKNKRHKTTVDWTCQMIMQVRRWLPNHPIISVGVGAYAAVKLLLCCAGFPISIVWYAAQPEPLYIGQSRVCKGFTFMIRSPFFHDPL